ncbi:MAG: condensation domain-containing protein, partial [Chitinophagaceae bacterium]
MKQFKEVIDLIYLAKQNDVDIVLNGERLQLKVPENKSIDKNLLEEIRNNKQAIIDFLGNENWKSKKVNENYNKINSFDRTMISHIPLSFAQERLWFVDQVEGSVLYNLPTVIRLKGSLNKKALVHAMQTVVSRHEALRTVFKEEEGRVNQFIKDAAGWELSFVDDINYTQKTVLHQYIKQLINEPFDLSKDYMVRASLIKLSEQEHVLIVTMHHIASDAWSTPIIVREVMELYAAYIEDRPARLVPLPIQYADYALWQRNYLCGEVLDKKIDYWENKLSDVVPLQLPTDYTRPALKTTRGAAISFNIDKKLSDQIQIFCQQQGASLYMTLLAVFKVLMHRYSNQQDICVGTSIANRSQQEVENLIGYFVNTLALRTEVKTESSFIELLRQVKATTM